jgi:hypothetical protein
MTRPHTPTEASPPAAPPAAASQPGYETRDVDFRAIVWLGLSVALTIVVGGAGVHLLLAHFHAEAQRADPATSPLADAAQIPPGPHLQPAPKREFREFRAAQEAALASYGWVDKKAGVVRIPIARAMDLLVERGLPAPTEPKLPDETEKK